MQLPKSTDEDLLLPGGTAHYGRVKRRGATVRRPVGEYSVAVHALLEHLADQGFDGAPRILGVDGETEVLSYLEGESAFRQGQPGTMPLPDWALTDAAMVSVADLLRRFHAAVASFDASGLRWQRPIPIGWAGPRITHNDTHPANVIFRGGRAIGLIDFDLAGPGSVPWELAVAACFWVPIRDAQDIDDVRAGRTFERLRLFLDAYGLPTGARASLVDALLPANEWIHGIIREAAEQGHPAFGRMWQLRAAASDRAAGWISRHRGDLLNAITAPIL